MMHEQVAELTYTSYVKTYREDGELAHFPLVIDKEDEMWVPRVHNEVVVLAERLDMLVRVLVLSERHIIDSCKQKR